MDFLICQTVAASPAEPGELPFWFRSGMVGVPGRSPSSFVFRTMYDAARGEREPTESAAPLSLNHNGSSPGSAGEAAKV